MKCVFGFCLLLRALSTSIWLEGRRIVEGERLNLTGAKSPVLH